MSRKKTHPETEVNADSGEQDCPQVDAIDEAQAILDALEQERDEMEQRWKRALADFQNFQRRAQQSESDARDQGKRVVLEGLIPILDHFDLALGQQGASDEQIVKGVNVIRDELFRVIESKGVSAICPEPNDPFDPMKHEALLQQAAEGVAPGHVSMLMQRGYSLNERVIRPAKVAVAPESQDESGAG